MNFRIPKTSKPERRSYRNLDYPSREKCTSKTKKFRTKRGPRKTAPNTLMIVSHSQKNINNMSAPRKSLQIKPSKAQKHETAQN